MKQEKYQEWIETLAKDYVSGEKYYAEHIGKYYDKESKIQEETNQPNKNLLEKILSIGIKIITPIIKQKLKTKNKEDVYYYLEKEQHHYLLTLQSDRSKIKEVNYITKEELPNNIKNGDILQKEEGEYIIQGNFKNKYQDWMENIAESMTNGVKYQVTEIRKDSIILINQDTKRTIVTAEIEEKLRNQIYPGCKITVNHGKYVYNR